jgi:hypothetical protein
VVDLAEEAAVIHLPSPDTPELPIKALLAVTVKPLSIAEPGAAAAAAVPEVLALQA